MHRIFLTQLNLSDIYKSSFNTSQLIQFGHASCTNKQSIPTSLHKLYIRFFNEVI